MTHLFLLSSAIHHKVHLPTPPGHSCFLSSILLSNHSLRSKPGLTSHSLPGYFAKLVLPASSVSSLFFSSFLYTAFPTSLFSWLLPVTLSNLYLHSLTHPTISEGPLAIPCTPFTLGYGFALFSNILPFASSPFVSQRSLPAQLYGTSLQS